MFLLQQKDVKAPGFHKFGNSCDVTGDIASRRGATCCGV